MTKQKVAARWYGVWFQLMNERIEILEVDVIGVESKGVPIFDRDNDYPVFSACFPTRSRAVQQIKDDLEVMEQRVEALTADGEPELDSPEEIDLCDHYSYIRAAEKFLAAEK